MSETNEEVIFESVECPADKSPIFYINVTAEVIKGNAKKGIKRTVKGMVAKGTKAQIMNSQHTKTRFLRELFSRENGGKKKAAEFDLDKVNIIDIEILKGLGYGVKSI